MSPGASVAPWDRPDGNAAIGAVHAGADAGDASSASSTAPRALTVGLALGGGTGPHLGAIMREALVRLGRLYGVAPAFVDAGRVFASAAPRDSRTAAGDAEFYAEFLRRLAADARAAGAPAVVFRTSFGARCGQGRGRGRGSRSGEQRRRGGPARASARFVKRANAYTHAHTHTHTHTHTHARTHTHTRTHAHNHTPRATHAARCTRCASAWPPSRWTASPLPPQTCC
jgi:hypothetical protein